MSNFPADKGWRIFSDGQVLYWNSCYTKTTTTKECVPGWIWHETGVAGFGVGLTTGLPDGTTTWSRPWTVKDNRTTVHTYEIHYRIDRDDQGGFWMTSVNRPSFELGHPPFYLSPLGRFHFAKDSHVPFEGTIWAPASTRESFPDVGFRLLEVRSHARRDAWRPSESALTPPAPRGSVPWDPMFNETFDPFSSSLQEYYEQARSQDATFRAYTDTDSARLVDLIWRWGGGATVGVAPVLANDQNSFVAEMTFWNGDGDAIAVRVTLTMEDDPLMGPPRKTFRVGTSGPTKGTWGDESSSAGMESLLAVLAEAFRSGSSEPIRVTYNQGVHRASLSMESMPQSEREAASDPGSQVRVFLTHSTTFDVTRGVPWEILAPDGTLRALGYVD